MVLNWFLIFLFLLAPPSVWGFSLERTESYKKNALEKRLYENPQWLRLGHYHSTWGNGQKSKLRGSFFIAKNGDTNPQDELLATIDSFFSDQTAATHQCRYLGRMRWLKSVLNIATEDTVPCPERDQWKAELGAQEVYIVFASSDLTSPGSSFGHTFLKFHNPANTQQLELLDYGVNYAALTGEDSGAIFALKGLFGFYPGNYSLLPYHQKIREYTNLEGRDIWEYKLLLSPDEVGFLVDHLLELDGSYSYYYFADENCSYQIMELLNLVRPEQNLTQSFHDFVIPLDTLKILADLSLLEGEKLRPSLQAEWQSRYAGLNLSQKKTLRDIVKNPYGFAFDSALNTKEKASVLEASLSYLAIKEYREQKERKDDKYVLAVQRAKLGQITDPQIILPPGSPLKSQNPQAFYVGYGKYHEKDYLNFKYRRAFHDVLSDDYGLTPFTHLEVMSFDFRYFTETKNLDLAHWVLLNVLSTSPTNILDHPLSWALDIGTRPKLAPYFDFAAGTSFDLSQNLLTRWTLLGRVENRTENDKYAAHLGPQMILMTYWNRYFRSFTSGKYLYSAQSHTSFWDYELGVSFSLSNHELRLQYMNRHNIADGLLSYIYFF